MAASSNEEKEPEVIEQENVENVEEEMNATAYETFDEGNEPENIEFYDVIEKLEKVPVMEQPPVEERRKLFLVGVNFTQLSQRTLKAWHCGGLQH